MSDPLGRESRRNALGLLLDMSGFGLGIAFINPSTILPVLVRQLTPEALLVGVFTTLWTGAWLLPQLPGGRFLVDKPRKKPYLVVASLICRPALILMAAVFALAPASSTALLLAVLFAGVLVFRAGDSLASVAWFDILSQVIPPHRRGRIISAGQILGALLALVAAAVVRWALSSSGPSFPRNYALLMALSFGGMALSLVGLVILKEPGQPVESGIAQGMNLLDHARHVVSADHAFRQVMAIRLLCGLAGMALPFYALHATQELGIPVAFLGIAVAVQNIAVLLSSAGLGALSERAGSTRVVQVSALATLMAPGLALGLHLLGRGTGWVAGAYVLVFASLSVVDNSIMLGYLDYVLQIAPPGDRPAYMGLTNTLSGLLVVLPIVGGGLLQLTSYPVLFSVAGAGAILGLLLALRLPSVGAAGQPAVQANPSNMG